MERGPWRAAATGSMRSSAGRGTWGTTMSPGEGTTHRQWTLRFWSPGAEFGLSLSSLFHSLYWCLPPSHPPFLLLFPCSSPELTQTPVSHRVHIPSLSHSLSLSLSLSLFLSFSLSTYLSLSLSLSLTLCIFLCV